MLFAHMVTDLIQFRKSPKELYSSWRAESVANIQKYIPLHLSYVISRVGVVSDVGEILNLREIDLLIFASN